MVENVSAAVWAYEVSGFRVVKRWFDRRTRDPEGRRSSPLDDLVATRWEPEWTEELVDLLNVLTFLIELEPDQGELLTQIVEGPLVTTEELRDAGVLPSVHRADQGSPGPREAHARDSSDCSHRRQDRARRQCFGRSPPGRPLRHSREPDRRTAQHFPSWDGKRLGSSLNHPAAG